jgi:NCS2 family nucleobase:cation symporter-2
MPADLKPIFGDAIIMTSLAAVLLNAYFNRTTEAEAEADTLLAAQGAGHI